jgi:hypothetical protein
MAAEASTSPGLEADEESEDTASLGADDDDYEPPSLQPQPCPMSEGEAASTGRL